MLRAIVEENGGRNVGHDHGAGLGLRPNEGEHGPCFDLCNDFFSYSEVLSRSLSLHEKSIAAKLVTEETPRFMAAPIGCIAPTEAINTMTDVEPMSLLYVAPVYLGERLAGMNCLPSDNVWLDWQQRLFDRLSAIGYRPIFKSHPEASFMPPGSLIDKPNVSLHTNSIESYMASPVTFCIDFLSTPFKAIVSSDRPIVIFDFGIGFINDEIREILARRCAIIRGAINKENRFDINWGDLQNALSYSESLRLDRTCARQLYGYSA